MSLVAILCSRADVIYKDSFSYSNGPAAFTSTNAVNSTLVTNWITHSGSNDCDVNNHRLEVSSSTVNGTFNQIRTGDIHRNFSITNGSIYTNAQQVMYASFIVNFTNLPVANGAYFAHFQNGSSGFEGKLWALTGNPSQTTNNFTTQPNTFRLGVSGFNSGLPSKVLGVDLALNTDYQVVLGWDPVSLFAVTLWVNPVNASDANVISGDSGTLNIAQSFGFRQASGFGGFLTVSNLVVATTFQEALTNVISTNAVAPQIVSQPLGTTNFVNSTINLASVANGQGLGSMTYQWYKDAAAYSNPGGNTNVLTIASAQTTDSGNYTVVAITPYGLSVTSAVAKVLISAAPVPPTFVTQPVKQLLYTGQNLVLTTTVSSPGNCTFTWYSNNVAVTTTGPDNSGASTFEIDNVLPVNSATYKVAVTNDVVANGIVSTNAVVTITDPPTVTVAFLRSLVDPNNNFQTTASPTQPYMVTGIITTFTNLTAANTTSYYLQDATAGINIFATFGSTFRPMMGDSVTFVGVMSSFSSGLELTADTLNKTYTSYTINSSGNALPVPLAIPFTYTNNNLSNVNYTIAGRYVQLTNVFFGTNSGNIVTNGFVTVSNALGQKVNLWFSAVDPDVIGQTFPVYAKTVTGVVFGSMNGGAPNFAVAPTRFADIDTNIAPVANPDSYGMAANSPVTTLVPSPLANDLVYPPAFPATITDATATSGTATIINAGADVQYQPAASFTGVDTINYTLTDALGGVSSSVISINVTNAAPSPIPVTAVLSGQNIVLTWGNSVFGLQSATNLTGPWSDISGATSPFTNLTTTNAVRFFRLKY